MSNFSPWHISNYPYPRNKSVPGTEITSFTQCVSVSRGQQKTIGHSKISP